MDPGFWDPALLSQLERLSQTDYPLISLGELEPFLTYGPIVVGLDPPNSNSGPLFINTPHFLPTGFAPLTQHVPTGSEWDNPRGHVQHGDVLLVRSGMATLGRTLVYLTEEPAIAGCYVTIIRQDVIQPCYLGTFLKSQYGQRQIQRLKHGVGTVNLSFTQTRAIVLPLVPEHWQTEFTERYRLMDEFHRHGNREQAEQQLGLMMQRLEHMLFGGNGHASTT